MPQIEERTARIEGILEQMSERITDLRAEVTERISALEGRVSGLEAEVKDLRTHLSQQISDNFRWTMAILIGSWITIIAVILTRGQ